MFNELKKAILKGLVVILVFGFFGFNAFARMVVNGTDEAFAGSGKEQIRVHVIRGAGYFLKSQSDFLLFLHRVEMSDLEGMDYVEAQGIIGNAVANMENAVKTYEALARQAEVTAYDPAVLPKMLNAKFELKDETGKMIDDGVSRQNTLSRAESFLREGDVRGVYFKLHKETQTLLAALNRVKAEVDAYRMPENGALWDLGRNYSDTLVFGHNVADIFARVTGK